MIKQENTYLGADGLAYCKICGEPVEAFFPPDSILGMKKHFRQCACIRQKREAEEKAYKEREHCDQCDRAGLSGAANQSECLPYGTYLGISQEKSGSSDH